MRPVQLWPWQPKIKIAIDEITDNVEYLSEVMVEAIVKLQQMITHLKSYSRPDNLRIREVPQLNMKCARLW